MNPRGWRVRPLGRAGRGDLLSSFEEAAIAQTRALRERAEKAEAAIARLVVACGDLDREARDSGSAEGFLGTSLITHLLSGGSLDDYDYTDGGDA